jgi:hypothetical protein
MGVLPRISLAARIFGHAPGRQGLRVYKSFDTAQKWELNCTNPGGQGRDRTGDLPLFRRTLIPTELPGRKAPPCLAVAATLTGLEPATSAVTGRRANQLRHRALLCDPSYRPPRVPPTGFEPALPP